MANLFKVTYEQGSPAVTSDRSGNPDSPPPMERSWDPAETSLVSESDAVRIFTRLRVMARSDGSIRNVRIWESNIVEPVFTDVTAAHLPARNPA